MTEHQTIKQYLQRIRPISLAIGAMGLLMLAVNGTFFAVGLASELAPLVSLLLLPLGILSFFLSGAFARWLGYHQPFTVVIGGGIVAFLMTSAVSISANILTESGESPAVASITIATIGFALGSWLVGLLTDARQKHLVMSPPRPIRRIRWPAGRILAVTSPLLAVGATYLSGHIDNVGLAGLWFVVAGIPLVALGVISAFFALISYYHPFTLITSSIIATLTVVFSVGVLTQYIESLPDFPFELPGWVVTLLFISSLSVIAFYTRDFEKIPK